MGTLPTYDNVNPTLVLGIDVGTTFSGVALCTLLPGKTPQILHVNRWKRQAASEFRVPTIIWYDKQGNVAQAGAETEEVQLQAELQGWVKVDWFKLHLKPDQLDSGPTDLHTRIPGLPAGKSVTLVFTDYLRFLYTHTQEFMNETSNATKNFLALNPKVVVVLSHPNGWEGPQQIEMRKAAMLAGIVSKREDVYFVSEGEAGLQYCAYHELCDESERIVIVDAGGGTVDISAYNRQGATPNTEASYCEVMRPQCHLQGGAIVTGYASDYIQSYLQSTAHHDCVETLTKDFDNKGKHSFNPTSDVVFINTGDKKIRDTDKRIQSGILYLTRDEVACFFEPTLVCIYNAITQLTKRPGSAPSVFFIGGLAGNEWLTENLRLRLNPIGVSLMRPDAPRKSVAEGAIVHLIGRSAVASRIPRSILGIEICQIYDGDNPEHRTRQTVNWPDGTIRIPGAFSIMVSELAPMGINQERYCSYSKCYDIETFKAIHNQDLRVEILRYRGPLLDPKWRTHTADWDCVHIISTPGQFINSVAQIKQGPIGPYVLIEFQVGLLYKGSEMHAKIFWRGPDGNIVSRQVIIVVCILTQINAFLGMTWLSFMFRF
ncbi:hypothetical protein AX16_007841 [Volvariella volvacea WC 439]|nr:hypothetical protein AX16_007841 [Volvariella volvacea WC 439]